MLTTFNEIDMSAVDRIARAPPRRFREEARRAARLHVVLRQGRIVALKELPAVNAEIDGDDIIYKNHYDIGVAVGTEQGLVVPVVRDADRMSFAEIEKTIAELRPQGARRQADDRGAVRAGRSRSRTAASTAR